MKEHLNEARKAGAGVSAVECHDPYSPGGRAVVRLA